jgi:hypothetical protein
MRDTWGVDNSDEVQLDAGIALIQKTDAVSKVPGFTLGSRARRLLC